MKAFCSIIALVLLAGCSQPSKEPLQLTTKQDSISYSIGSDLAGRLKRQNIPIDRDVMFRAINDAFDSAATALTPDETRAVLTALEMELRRRNEEKQREVYEKIKNESEAFMTENKTKEGVVTLPSGLQYKVIQQGTGPRPKPKQTVTVHYKGTFIDGHEFDSSRLRGEAATFRLDRVIKGWSEGIVLMPVGSKWILYVPPELGYGDRGSPPTIPPYAALIFELELLGLQ